MPTDIRTADGVTVHNGDRVWNYYDLQWVTIVEEPDNEGWFYVRDDNGGLKTLNGERISAVEIHPR